MAPLPPPHGMSEVDYEAIEAAVTETVRGRWFLNEFARRNRTAELRQLLDAMSRLENAVATGPALPPADPSIRLMMQRIKEIARQLQTLASEMRVSGADERFILAVDNEARAVSGMLRGPAPALLPATPIAGVPLQTAAPPAAAGRSEHVDATSAGERRPDVGGQQSVASAPGSLPNASDDPRLAALAGIDGLTFTEKLALFS